MGKPVYPSLDDPQFAEKIAQMEDFSILQMPISKEYKTKEAFETRIQEMCSFEKTYYQHFVQQFISPRTPYKSMLIYHGLGSGKTCSSVTLAEAFSEKQRLNDEPNIWVISRKALKGSFEQEIFRTLYLTLQPSKDLRKQCMGDIYLQQIPNASKMPYPELIQRIQKIIKSKYKFFGYDQFANAMEKLKEENRLSEVVQNKVLIIDEAHNLRNLESQTDKQKKIIEPIVEAIKQGTNNRLILMSATPMYNEADELLWLLSLLCLNDRRTKLLNPFELPSFFTHGKRNEKVFQLCASLCQNYVSYIKGNNPFTFAVRLKPPMEEVAFLHEVPKITLSGKPLEKREDGWHQWITDGLVTSPLGATQMAAIQSVRSKKHVSSATLRQMNVFSYKKHLGQNKYEYRDGKDALLSIFRRADDLEPVQYVYQNPKEPVLNPAFGQLSDIASKLHTLSELIRSSKGIVLIYSMFIWGGIVPTALMLEHLGFSRYKERDFLKMTQKASHPVSYKGIQKPSYCILSSESDRELMGSTRMDDLLKDINADSNQNGETIKVILISPVAGEGLNLKNIREMHILDPWYHLNNQEQAIGRAIRNCSHSLLPLEERNVTVFLHATVNPTSNQETSDLHAYRLAALKYKEIMEVDQWVQKHAVDCGLMKQVNYYDRSLFNFEVVLRTSRGKQLPYHYGDDPKKQITCNSTGYKTKDARAFQSESYRRLIPTLQEKLRKYLQENYQSKGQTLFTYEELIMNIHPHPEISTKVLEASLIPYRLWENKRLMYHWNQFLLVDVDSKMPTTSRLPIPEVKTVALESTTQAFEQVLEGLVGSSTEVTLLKVFQSLDVVQWQHFAESIVTRPTESLSSGLKTILGLFESQGAFILKTELPSKTPSNYSGYVDLFSSEDQFKGWIWEDASQDFREWTDGETKRLQQKRRLVPFPNPSKIKIVKTIGFVQRYKSKEPNVPDRFQFKLGFNNETQKRSGVVCETLKKPQIETELKSLGIDIKGNVSQMCFQVCLGLLQAKRFWFPPIYKP